MREWPITTDPIHANTRSGQVIGHIEALTQRLVDEYDATPEELKKLFKNIRKGVKQ